MKFSYLIFLFSMIFGVHSHASIEGASNITNKKIAVNVYDEKSNARQLLLLDLNSKNKESVTLPKLVNEEIISLILFKDHLILVSQWTTGGGKNPKVHQYSLKTKRWLNPIEVKCISFDKIEVKKTTVRFNCEGQAAEAIKINFKAPNTVSQKLPVQEDKKENLEFKLTGGSLFKWDSIEIINNKKQKHTLSYKELLQKPKN